jgi:hypothetical protein
MYSHIYLTLPLFVMIFFTFISFPGWLLCTFHLIENSRRRFPFVHRPTGNAAHSLVRPRRQERASSSGAFCLRSAVLVESAST